MVDRDAYRRVRRRIEEEKLAGASNDGRAKGAAEHVGKMETHQRNLRYILSLAGSSTAIVFTPARVK